MVPEITIEGLRAMAQEAGLKLSDEELQRLLPGVNRAKKQAAELRTTRPARKKTMSATAKAKASARMKANFRGEDIAAVIVEPVCGNMGVIPPQPGFPAALREITRRQGALLILTKSSPVGGKESTQEVIQRLVE